MALRMIVASLALLAAAPSPAAYAQNSSPTAWTEGHHARQAQPYAYAPVPLNRWPLSPPIGTEFGVNQYGYAAEGYGIDTGGTYRTLCVRLCDGYYFPISFSTSRSGLGRDADRCTASCGTEGRLYFYPTRDGDIETMVDVTGRGYASLPTAFKYRKALVEGCSCRPQPWTEAELGRHRGYADGTAQGEDQIAGASSSLEQPEHGFPKSPAWNSTSTQELIEQAERGMSGGSRAADPPGQSTFDGRLVPRPQPVPRQLERLPPMFPGWSAGAAPKSDYPWPGGDR